MAERRAWSEADVGTLRARAGAMTAAEIGALLGRPLSAVHAKAERLGVPLKLTGEAHDALNRRRGEGIKRAWARPASRAAYAARSPSGAAVAGAARKRASFIPLPPRKARFCARFLAAGWPPAEVAQLFNVAARRLTDLEVR